MRALPHMLLAGLFLMAGTAAAQGGTTQPALDDPAIVGIFDAANSWDIETGSLAESKASRQTVKSFGAMLARDHRGVQQQGRDLAKKLGVTPTPVAADFPLKKAHEETMTKLRSLSGDAFDKAFLQHEVDYHRAVIDAINSTLKPAIKNAELKALVEKVAPAFEAHMRQAQELLKQIQ